MDDGKLAVLADVGVGVDVVRRAVGRPAGMAHADGALHIRAAVDEVAQCLEPAHGFFDLKLMPRRNDRDTGAVIAAVFQTGEAVEQNGGSLLAADVSNNTTHKKVLLYDRAGLRRKAQYPLRDQKGKRTEISPFPFRHSPFVPRSPAYLSAVCAPEPHGEASAEKFDHLPPRRPPRGRLMALCRF